VVERWVDGHGVEGIIHDGVFGVRHSINMGRASARQKAAHH
jgi:hypothetical protein